MIERALVLLTTLAIAAPAAAAETAGEHGGGGENNLFAGDVGNAIWTVVIFGLVVFVLGKFAWGPLLRGLQAREEFIRESLEKARMERETAETRLREYEQKLATARAEATAIVEEGRRDAEVVRHRIEATAKQEGEAMVERARREIQLATDTATKELFTLSARLATQMAAKVVGRELTPQDHERLIAEAIDGIDSTRPN
jgi:F-type H+-transporting ATPase subunit b